MSVPPPGKRAAVLREARRLAAIERARQLADALGPRLASATPAGELERLAAIEAVCDAVRDEVAAHPALAGAWRLEFLTYLGGPEGDERTVRLEIQLSEASV